MESKGEMVVMAEGRGQLHPCGRHHPCRRAQQSSRRFKAGPRDNQRDGAARCGSNDRGGSSQLVGDSTEWCERTKQGCFLTAFVPVGSEKGAKAGEILPAGSGDICGTVLCCPRAAPAAGNVQGVSAPGLCLCAAGGHGVLRKGGPGQRGSPGVGREGWTDTWMYGQMG